MNITVRIKVDDDEKSPVTALMAKLAGIDVDVIEVWDEAERPAVVQKNYSSAPKPSDVASATSAAVRREVQNG